ncbi:hypothetical protein ABPG72_014089 [Tetrahymena utriculariae]
MSSIALLAFILATVLCGGLVRLLETYQDYTETNKTSSFHPLMQPFLLFLSSSMCITVYILKTKNPKFIVRRKNFKWSYLLVPALLFLINVFQNIIAIRYLYNGLYVIMKSISLISNVVMEKCFYPHRSYTKNQFTGLVLVVTGQAAVGIYSLVLTSNMDIIDINNSVEINIIFGITLLLIGIFPMAFYYLLQERFMKAFKLDPFSYVGTQGIVNSLITLILILCFQWFPCSNKTCQFQIGNEFYLERVDVWWEQLTSSYFFLYTTLTLFLFFAVQMYLEFFIMKTYSGIACNITSTLYLLIPYIYILILGKLPFDFVVVGGFLIIVTGVLIFYHIPNFSQIDNLNSYTSSSATVPEFQTDIQRSSLEDQLNPTSSQDRAFYLEENVKNESSNSSKNISKNKQSLEVNQNSLMNKNRFYQQQMLDDQYVPPNQLQQFNRSNKYNITNMQQQTYQQQQDQSQQIKETHKKQKNQKLITAINNTCEPSKLVCLNCNNCQQMKQQKQNQQINYSLNQINYVHKQINQLAQFNSQVLNNREDQNDQQNAISQVDGRLSNTQYQNIQKSQNSQSNNEDDDSSIYYNNKFLRNNRSKANSKSNATQVNQNTQNSFNDNIENDYFYNMQITQNEVYQQNEQINNEQNDQNSIVSNNTRINRCSGSGLWINQSNNRNTSNLYDQSILLLNSQISEQNQSSILYKETTLRQQNDQKSYNNNNNNNNLEPNQQSEEENQLNNSPYIQREKKSNLSNKSMYGKKQKNDKKIILSQNNFQEDFVLNQNDISLDNYDSILSDQSSNQNEISKINKFQNSSIPQPSVSPKNTQVKGKELNAIKDYQNSKKSHFTYLLDLLVEVAVDIIILALSAYLFDKFIFEVSQMLYKNLFILLLPIVIIIVIGFYAMFEAKQQLSNILNTTKQQLRNDTIENIVILSSFIEYKLELILSQLYFHNLIMSIFQNKVMRNQVLVSPKMQSLAINLQDFQFPNQYPPYVENLLYHRNGDKISQYNHCSKQFKSDYDPVYQRVLQQNQYADVLSRSIYYSLKSLDIRPYSFVQIYQKECFMYGYPFQYSGRIEDSDAFKNPNDFFKNILDKLRQCEAQNPYYNFQCIPWFSVGSLFDGMYISFPGFNGDSEYVIGLCHFFDSNIVGEDFMDRQICDAIKLEDLNNYVKSVTYSLDYYYILDRQLQLVAMHSNYSFANVTINDVTWDSIELNHLTFEEKNDFLSTLPKQFYQGQNESYFQESNTEMRRNQDAYFVGEYTKQGEPYLYVAYKIFLLDPTPQDKSFNYQERVYSQIKNYKNYYTVFNVVNQNSLFQQQYQLQQNIDNVYFLLLFIQIACSIVIILYSIFVSLILVNSINQSLEILIYLLKNFSPEQNMDLTALQSNLIPFDQVSDIFCYEINLIYAAFKNLMHVITFRNKTSQFSQLSDGQSLLDWVFACQFFQNIMGNHSFLGISYNNLGNIHFNSHRYLESCQCYNVSLIHLNYELIELNQSDETYCSQFSQINDNKIQTPMRKTKNSSKDYHFVNNQQVNTRQGKTHSTGSIIQIVKKKISSLPKRPEPEPPINEAQDIYKQNQTYQHLLHLKFERSFQYIRSQKMYFLTQKAQTNLWKEQINQLKQLYVLDLVLQPPQHSRTIMILLELSFCYLMKKKTEKAKVLISLCQALFTYNTQKCSDENINIRQAQNAKVNWFDQDKKNSHRLENQKQSVLINKHSSEQTTKRKINKNIFEESEQAYIKVLQQISPVLQNPLIKQAFDEISIQKSLQEEINSNSLRKNSERVNYSQCPSPKFNREQADTIIYNIQEAVELIGLNKFNLNKQSNTKIYSGYRQTSDISSKDPYETYKFKSQKRNSNYGVKAKQTDQNYLIPLAYPSKNLENQKFRSSSFLKANQKIKDKKQNITNDDEIQTNQNCMQDFDIQEMQSGEQINAQRYKSQAKQSYDIINQRKSFTFNNNFLMEPRISFNQNPKDSTYNLNQQANKFNKKITSDQKLYAKRKLDKEINNSSSRDKDDLYDQQYFFKNNANQQTSRKNSNIQMKSEIKNISNNLEKQIQDISFIDQEMKKSKSEFLFPCPYVGSQLSMINVQQNINDKSFQNMEHCNSFNKTFYIDHPQQNQQKDYPNDVVFSKIMLSLANLFKSQGQLLKAAQIATNSLEMPTQYFALYRYESLQLINNCFSQLQMYSEDLSKQIKKFNQHLFLSLSIVIDYGNNSASNKISKILQELCENQMKNPKDSFQIILAREYCETLVTKIYRDQYLSLQSSINSIFKCIPQKISRLSKASSNNRVNLFKPLTKLLAEYQMSSLIKKNLSQNKSEEESLLISQFLLNQNLFQKEPTQKDDSLNQFEMKVIIIFSDMKFPISIIYNQEINNIFLSNNIHLIIFDINGLSLINPEFFSQNNSLDYIHIFCQPFQLINFFCNLRENSHQLEEPTYVQAI